MSEWDDDDLLGGEEEGSEVEEHASPSTTLQNKGRGRGRGRGRGTAVKKHITKQAGKAKAKAKAESSKLSKKCFAATCFENNKNNSRWCAWHHKHAEALDYQAKSKGPAEQEAVRKVLQDSGKAGLALEDFEAQNAGGRFRKRLIDWGAWCQRYGVRRSITEREDDELMDLDDYWEYRKKNNKDIPFDTVKAEWQDMLDSNHEGEGEGAARLLWISKNRTRMRGRTRYIDGAYEEGSKHMKKLSDKDKEDLKDFASSSASSFNNNFLREPTPVAPKPKQSDDVMQEATLVEVALAGPKAYDAHSKAIPEIKKLVETCITTAESALNMAVESPNPDDQLQKSFELTTTIRLHFLKGWDASCSGPMPARMPLPSSGQSAPVNAAAQASKAAQSPVSSLRACRR